jgi:hypothetical protein
VACSQPDEMRIEEQDSIGPCLLRAGPHGAALPDVRVKADDTHMTAVLRGLGRAVG